MGDKGHLIFDSKTCIDTIYLEQYMQINKSNEMKQSRHI